MYGNLAVLPGLYFDVSGSQQNIHVHVAIDVK